MKLKVLLMVAAVTFTATAQTTIRVAASSSSGTYKKMLGEIIANCADDSLNIADSNASGGAPGNLEALFNNQADAAFLHSDVYFAHAQADPAYNKIQTLVALYPEPIHVLVLRDSKTSKPGLSFGKVQFNSLVDARGFTVGAAGGGVFTARILGTPGGFRVMEYQSGDEVVNALNNGSVAAAIFVGGAPLPNIEKLSGQTYKLIPVGDTILSQLQNVYRSINITYHGLTNGPVKTGAPLAVLLTRKFSTQAKIDAQVKLRACFTRHLPDLQDNGSPSWQQVEAGDHGLASIPWLDLPMPAAAHKK